MEKDTDMLINAVVPMWRASLTAVGLAERTIDTYARHLKRFTTAFPAVTVQALNLKQILTYSNRLGQAKSAKTVGLFYSSVRSFCRFCIDAGLRDDDPTLRLRYPKRKKTLPRPLKKQQIASLLYELRQPVGLPPVIDFYWRRNRLVIYLMLYAGLRLSETAGLRWADVSDDLLIVRDGKGGNDRSVPLHAALKEQLSDPLVRRGDTVITRPNGGLMDYKSISHIFDRWIPREIGNMLDFTFTAHQLRHSFATFMVANQANIMAVKELMGHKDIDTTKQYVDLNAEHLAPAIEALPTHWGVD